MSEARPSWKTAKVCVATDPTIATSTDQTGLSAQLAQYQSHKCVATDPTIATSTDPTGLSAQLAQYQSHKAGCTRLHAT